MNEKQKECRSLLLPTAGGAKQEDSFKSNSFDESPLAPKRGNWFFFLCKRLFDIVFSLIISVLLCIPLLIVCICICFDSPGFPIYCQKRVGKNGKPIYILKLRTMLKDANEHPELYLSKQQLEEWVREKKVKDDPRITKIGYFLRKTSLDELPQFANVFIGDLSVIGPRPVTEEETYEYGEVRDEILSIRPGITGWWQVTGRNEATWANGDRQKLELFYVRHVSLGLDLRVFARTFKAMGRGQ